MEQRPLRLGDIVDDYCPRERRITNHAIVALVGEAIRQTRCTTCDADHVYKGGQSCRAGRNPTRALDDQVWPMPPPAQLVAATEGRRKTSASRRRWRPRRDRSDDPAVSQRSGDDDRAGQRNGRTAMPEPAQPDDQRQPKSGPRTGR